MPRPSKIWSFLLLGALLAAAGIGAMAWRGEWFTRGVEAPLEKAAEKAEKLAELIEFLPRVTYRRNSDFLWQEALPKLDLFNLDAVQTHEAASASIRLNNGSEINLGEKTMVLISPQLGTGPVPSPDRALVHHGHLTGQTKTELWILTSAALLHLKPDAASDVAEAVVKLEEGRRVSIELKKGSASILRRKGEKRNDRPERIPVAIEKPLELRVPETLFAPDAVGEAEKQIAEADALIQDSLAVPREAAGAPPAPTVIPIPTPTPAPSPKPRRTASVPKSVPPPAPKPLKVLISSPANYSEVKGPFTELRGLASGEGGILVNGRPVKISDHEFRLKVPLKIGVNSFLIHSMGENRESNFLRWILIRRR